MTEQTDTKQIDSTPSSATTRRAVIQWLAGVPLIPVVGSTAFSMLASRAAEAGIMAKSVEFIGMPAPTLNLNRNYELLLMLCKLGKGPFRNVYIFNSVRTTGQRFRD